MNPKGMELAEVTRLADMQRARAAGNLIMYPALETFRSVSYILGTANRFYCTNYNKSVFVQSHST